MPNKFDTIARREAGLESGIVGHDETLEAFAERTAAEDAPKDVPAADEPAVVAWPVG